MIIDFTLIFIASDAPPLSRKHFWSLNFVIYACDCPVNADRAKFFDLAVAIPCLNIWNIVARHLSHTSELFCWLRFIWRFYSIFLCAQASFRYWSTHKFRSAKPSFPCFWMPNQPPASENNSILSLAHFQMNLGMGYVTKRSRNTAGTFPIEGMF